MADLDSQLVWPLQDLFRQASEDGGPGNLDQAWVAYAESEKVIHQHLAVMLREGVKGLLVVNSEALWSDTLLPLNRATLLQIHPREILGICWPVARAGSRFFHQWSDLYDWLWQRLEQPGWRIQSCPDLQQSTALPSIDTWAFWLNGQWRSLLSTRGGQPATALVMRSLAESTRALGARIIRARDTVDAIEDLMRSRHPGSRAAARIRLFKPFQPTPPPSPVSSFEDRLEGVSALSFDVFDTCVMRRVVQAYSVFQLIALDLVRQSREYAEAFPELRESVEHSLRQEAQESGELEDVSLQAIYRALAGKLALADDERDWLCATEIDWERRLCYPNPVFTPVITRTRETGRPVTFTSEMYLPPEILVELIGIHYEPGNAIYTSGSTGLSKGSGKLFHFVAGKAEVAEASVLHVGDNESSDVAAAHNAGLKTWHWSRHYQPAAICEQLDEFRPEKADLQSSLFAGLARERCHSPATTAERLGFEVAGPLYFFFARHVLEKGMAEWNNRMVFLGRDGYFPERFARKMVEHWSLPLETTYLPCSRQLYALAGMERIEAQDWDFLLKPAPGLTLRAALERVGLEVEGIAASCRKQGLPDPDEAIADHRGFMRNYYRDALYHVLSEHIDELLAVRDRLLPGVLAFLRSQAPDSGYLVDLGWQGSATRYLRRLFGRIQSFRPRVILFGSWESAASMLAEGDEPDEQPALLPSAFVHLGQPEERMRLLQASIPVVEFICSAPEGPAKGWEHDEEQDRLIPLRAELEAGRMEALQGIRRGAEEFLARALPLLSSFPFEAGGTAYLEAVLDRVLRHPPPEEAALLGAVHHEEGWGTDSVVPIFQGPQEAMSPDALVSIWKASQWPAGLLTILSSDQRQMLADALEKEGVSDPPASP